MKASAPVAAPVHEGPLDLATLPDEAFAKPWARRKGTPFRLGGQWYRALHGPEADPLLRALALPVVRQAQHDGLLVRTVRSDLQVLGAEAVLDHETLRPFDPRAATPEDLLGMLETYLALQRLLLGQGLAVIDPRLENFGRRRDQVVWLDFDGLRPRRAVGLHGQALAAAANLLAPLVLLTEGNERQARRILGGRLPVSLSRRMARRLGLPGLPASPWRLPDLVPDALRQRATLAGAWRGLRPEVVPDEQGGEDAFLAQVEQMVLHGRSLAAPRPVPEAR